MRNTLSDHPPSLKTFFLTEMWERYGFYVVQTLLVLYLVMHFRWADNETYPLIGAFTALTYLSPVLGGWIADHLLGQKRSVVIGASILFCSYVALSCFRAQEGLYYSLAGIAVGTGLLKPNISSLLGNEYPSNSPKRERGFTIFYLGITTGIILGTTIPSLVQSKYGWAAAFFSAAIGMVIALGVFVYGIKSYKTKDYTPHEFNFTRLLIAVVFLILLYFGAHYILCNAPFAEKLFVGIGVLSSVYLIFTISQETGQQARQTIVIGLLCLISIMFWSFYFQMFSSIMVFLKRVTQPSLFGIPFPPPYFVTIQSIGMIIFGLFLGRKNNTTCIKLRTIQAGNKFVLSMVFMCMAYGLLSFCSNLNMGYALFTPLYFIPSYLAISLAELLLSPVGLASMTLLASSSQVSTMMGIFFVSLGMGGFLSGKIANLAAIPREKLESLSIIELKATYSIAFTHMLYLLLAATVISFLLNLVIRFLMSQGNSQR